MGKLVGKERFAREFTYFKLSTSEKAHGRTEEDGTAFGFLSQPGKARKEAQKATLPWYGPQLQSPGI